MLDVNRLKNKIKQAFIDEQTEESDHDASVDRIAQKLAQAIVDEIKEAKVNYTAGLTAPNGAVTGTINHTIS